MRNALDQKMYYLLILLLALFMSFISFFLAPIFAITNTVGLLVAAIIGMSMGWFISIFLREIDYLTKHHHASVLIVVAVCVSVSFSMVNLQYISNPFSAIAIFIVSFLLPYIYIHR